MSGMAMDWEGKERERDERDGGRGNKTWRLRRKREERETVDGKHKTGGCGRSFGRAGDRKRGDDKIDQGGWALALPPGTVAGTVQGPLAGSRAGGYMYGAACRRACTATVH